MLPSPLRLQARPLGPLTFEATSAFTFVTAQWLAVIPRMIWSIGFKDSVSFLLALQVGSEEARLRAGLRPPLKLHGRFCRMQLLRRLTVWEMPAKELIQAR